jgi:rubrerythrin
MQNFEQVKDVLDYGKTVHADLRKFYASLNGEDQQERVKMLLDYLSRHEQHLEETMSRFEAVSHQDVLDTWMQYAPSINVLKLIGNQEIRPCMSVDEVVKLVVEFDDALVEFYREAANECDLPRVKEVFLNLIELENHEKLRHVRDALFQDM